MRSNYQGAEAGPDVKRGGNAVGPSHHGVGRVIRSARIGTILLLLSCGAILPVKAQVRSLSASSSCNSKSRPELSFPFLRYDEDWSFLACSPRADRWDRIKYLPISKDGKVYLSVGGDARAVYESYDNQYWGDGPQGQAGWIVHHYLLHADVHAASWFRLFTEVQSGLENGRVGGPRPYDEDQFDIHQAFVDLKCCESKTNMVVRVGRQELYYGSGRLVDARFGLNTRISFDGVKVIALTGRTNTEVFATRPTLQRPGILDDTPDSKTAFWGIYSTTQLRPSMSVDFYYLGYKAKTQTFARGSGEYQPNTLGVRWAAAARHLDYDEEANLQVGTFQNDKVQAWSVASMIGYKLERRSRPRVSLRSDVTSGDKGGKGSPLGSFFPLYARGKYFGEADLSGPVNTLDLIPALDLHPRRDVAVNISYGAFWRKSTQDGIYGFAGNLYKPGAESSAQLIGQQGELDLNYFIAPHTIARIVYQHFFPGTFLRQTPPGKEVNYVTVWLDYHF